ncbi:MAG: hypothetical protein NVS4B1_36570 [Ktedonobacteraceae bacterium]
MTTERDLDMTQNGFEAEDFAPIATVEQHAAYHTHLFAEYCTPLEIRVWSETHEDVHYDVDHDRERPTFCPCKAYQFKQDCKHMKRVQFVLLRRQARLTRATFQPEPMTAHVTVQKVLTEDEKRSQAPLNGNKPFRLL